MGEKTKYSPSTGSLIVDFGTGLYTAPGSAAEAFSLGGGIANDVMLIDTLASTRGYGLGQFAIPVATAFASAEAVSRITEGDYKGAGISIAANGSGIVTGYFVSALVGSAGFTGFATLIPPVAGFAATAAVTYGVGSWGYAMTQPTNYDALQAQVYATKNPLDRYETINPNDPNNPYNSSAILPGSTSPISVQSYPSTSPNPLDNYTFGRGNSFDGLSAGINNGISSSTPTFAGQGYVSDNINTQAYLSFNGANPPSSAGGWYNSIQGGTGTWTSQGPNVVAVMPAIGANSVANDNTKLFLAC